MSSGNFLAPTNEAGLDAQERGYLCAWCGQSVEVLQPGFEPSQPPYCSLHHVLVGRDPRDIGTWALDDAIDLLNTPSSSLIRWPWDALNELAGPLVPGRLTYLAAFPGSGKTTVVSHLIKYWMSGGLKVSVLPLEADPLEVMARIGCLELGINADDALSMRLRVAADSGVPWAQQQLAKLTDWMRERKKNAALLQQLRIEPLDALTPHKFSVAVRVAGIMQSDIIIVDHVDEVEGEADDYTPEIQLSNRIQSMALSLAKELRIPIVLTTQLNSSRTGGDPLAQLRPPISDWLYNKGKKVQKAATILGMYRPMVSDLSKEERREASEASDSLRRLAKPHTMGFAGMKLRYGGSSLGTTCELHYEHGRLTDQSDHLTREHLNAMQRQHHLPGLG